LYDQRITLVVADRITHPLAQWGRWMLAADANDTHVMDHFNEDDDRVLVLNDLIVVVVHERQHRRSGARTERHEATLAQRPCLRTCGRAGSLNELATIGIACLCC